MSFVTSADGTKIAYERMGEGPPLLLIHGCGVSRVLWESCTSRFVDNFTVYLFDRRGRGKSGDSETYSLERETEDILALIDTIGEPVAVFGHSFGANCALEAAKRSDHITKLVLYEPRIPVPPHDEGPDFAPELWEYVENGQEEHAKRQFFIEMVGSVPFTGDKLPEPVRRTPARTLAREITAAEGSTVGSDLPVSAPTLLLDAEESSAYFRDATKKIDKALSQSHITSLHNIGHETITDDIVIDPVLDFLTKSDSSGHAGADMKYAT